MAAQRCANPAYLSEVNRMMLEYSLHKTIKEHIELFKEISISDDRDLKSYMTSSMIQTSSASTLTQIYDALITLTQAGKASAPQDQIVRFDISLLQLLVLLRTWMNGRLEAEESETHEFSAETCDNLTKERFVNQMYRTLFHHYRSHPNTAPEPDANLAWNIRHKRQLVHLADHIVPRFMEISEQLFSIFHGLSEKWMHLAANLLIQSAIEVFSTLNKDDSIDCRDALESCFAWGYVERPRFTESFDRLVAPQLHFNSKYRNLDINMHNELLQIAGRKAEVEDRIWEMFYNPGSDDNPSHSSAESAEENSKAKGVAKSAEKRTPQSSGELKPWTEVRQNALDDVQLTYTRVLKAGKEHMNPPLQLLRDQYPLNNLLTQLTDFIEKHWKILHARKGLPVLVQIEEGRLDGMDAEAFERFKQRAGITDMP